MVDWPDLASTDPKQIAAWNADNPNYNCGLVAKDDGHLILEFDVASGMRDAAAEMGQTIPLTRAHRSGGGYGHWILKQTDRSRAVGNRSVNRLDPCSDPKCPKAKPGKVHHHEWFSFRQHNKYVVGPGSIHPNGTEYTVMREMTPVLCPDWVCDFVEKHSAPERPASSEGRVSVCDDFDFDALMEWYEIEIVNVDGYWHNPAECPVKDGPHTAVTDCAFWYDGDTLGWHDFSQGCAGSSMSIGAVLRHLNQEHEPYPERIWPGEGTDWLDDDQIDQVESAARPETKQPETSLSASSRATLNAILKEAEQDEDEADEAVPARAVLTAEQMMSGLSHKANSQAFVENGLRPMPEGALYGWLGKRAKLLGLPLGLAYPAILTCYSALPKMPNILGNHYALYTVVVMAVGGGKNVTLNRSTKVLEMRLGVDYMDATLGGVGGLWQLLGEKTEGGGKGKDKVVTPGPARMLINPSEFGATMINMKIKNSTLATHLCNLWDKPQITLPVREGTRPINCRLFVLGALPANKDAPETFTRYFSVETGEGLYSRFLFAFSEEKLDLRWAEEWKPEIPFSEDMYDDLVPIGNLKGWTQKHARITPHSRCPVTWTVVDSKI